MDGLGCGNRGRAMAVFDVAAGDEDLMDSVESKQRGGIGCLVA